MVLRRDEEWLSITPEPEGELPPAVAALRAGGVPDAGEVQAERDYAELLITRARRRAYERWLADIRGMAAEPRVERSACSAGGRRRQRVIENHDALALGLRRREGRGGRGQ